MAPLFPGDVAPEMLFDDPHTSSVWFAWPGDRCVDGVSRPPDGSWVPGMLTTLLTFAGVAWLATLVPGPDTAVLVKNAVVRGPPS